MKITYYNAMNPFKVLGLLFKTVIDLFIPLISAAWNTYQTIEDALSPVLIPIRIAGIVITAITSLLLILFKKNH